MKPAKPNQKICQFCKRPIGGLNEKIAIKNVKTHENRCYANPKRRE